MTNPEIANQSGVFSRLGEMPGAAQGLLAAGIATAALGFGAKSAEASTPSPQESPSPATLASPAMLPSTVSIRIGAQSATAAQIASGEVTVLGNIKYNGESKAKVRRAERNGDCFNVGEGTKYGQVWTEGFNVSGDRRFGPDSRRSRVCRIGGKLIRIVCGNEVKISKRPKNAVDTPIMWARSIGRTKARVEATAVAVSSCAEGGASAFAFGYGHSEARINIRNINRVKAKGNAKTAYSVYTAAYGKADAMALASTTCVSAEAEVTNPFMPPKDDPTPPAGAPN